MKTITWRLLPAFFFVLLAVFPGLGQEPAPVLARVEVLGRVDRLGLPVYAHLRDAQGRDYALVVAKEDELKRAGWPFTVLAINPAIDSLSLAVARLPEAQEQARAQIAVLYDDGRRLVVTPTPQQAAALAGLGMAVIRINTPLVWPPDPEGAAASRPARRGLVANAAISNLMNQVREDTLSNLTARLDGELPATIGGESYTILTRGTSSGTPIQKATQFVYEQMQAAGLEVSYQGWTSNSFSGSNVVGIKRGTTRSNEVVLVTAHLDSMPNDDSRAPGADDNASGCVGVMAAASVFRGIATDRTIRFICFGGEEQGLLGSDAYALSIQHAGESNVTVFNMDMIAYSTLPSRELSLHTRLPSHPAYADDLAVATTFRDVIAAYGLDGRLTAKIMADGEEASDHYSFWSKGYPGVLAIESDTNFNPCYHTSGDMISNFNMAYFTDFVRASVGAVGHLAGVPGGPAKVGGLSVSAGAFKDRIRVSWWPAEDATGYKIWRSRTNDSATAQLLGATASTNIDDTGAEVNRVYFYWVQATNGYGSGDFSEADSGYELLGPCIFANGLDGTVPLGQGGNLGVTVELNPDIYAGVPVDWWVVALAGSAWYYLNSSMQWMEFDGSLSHCPPVYQGALVNLAPTAVLNMTGLPVGAYTFWFAVDYPMDGILDPRGQVLYDDVTVIVQ